MLGLLLDSEKSLANASASFDAYQMWDGKIATIMIDTEKAMEPAYQIP
jgi:hypothetical protein